MTKYCPQCKQLLPDNSFHKNKGRADGLSGLCKHHANLTQKKYQQTERGKQVNRKKAPRHRKKHADRLKARNTLNYAITSGVLQRDICAICGSSNAEIHHPNYRVPNNIYWLCNKHHLEQHGKIKGR